MDNTVHSQDDEYGIPKIAYPSATNSIVYSILALYVIHHALVYLDYPVLSPQELLWNAIVYLIPAPLLLDVAKRVELRENNMLSQTHAAKSEALRRMLRLTTGGTLSPLSDKLVGGEEIMRTMSNSMGLQQPVSNAPTSDAPPGLGNWDNSCYQNSVLQGLSALESLKSYLGRSSTATHDTSSTSGSLMETIGKLNNPGNNGKQLWTPAKLKSMSSWQQQDAQEYFSKMMDELDKEAARARKAAEVKLGIVDAVAEKQSENASSDREDVELHAKNPMEGLMAQRVACTRCGFSEGLSMIPFNCLTVPLGSSYTYELEDCLDEYTKLEEINDVECAKCTLLRAESQLRQMLPATEKAETPAALELPPELRVLAAKRLQAIQTALDEDDFADKTLNETCQIPKRAHVSSTKTRQAVIGRAPQSLVVHVNRSVFDEMIGVQRKNYASVRYPLALDFGEWMLGTGPDPEATKSMLQGGGETRDRFLYRLQAVVTHYGRHENGHYIAYRRHPVRPSADAELEGGKEGERRQQWWRLSDEDVSAVSEQDVLAQGGVFMLFYERESRQQERKAPEMVAANIIEDTTAAVETDQGQAEAVEAASIPLPPDAELDFDENAIATASPADRPAAAVEREAPAPETQPAHDDEPSTGTTTEDEADADDTQPRVAAQTPVVQKPPTPPLMRTARGRQASRQESRGEKGGFGNAFRPMAAT